MEANQYLNDFYNHYDEDSRLLFQHGSVEFLTTMRYICLLYTSVPRQRTAHFQQKAHLQQPEYPVRQAERLPGQGPCGRDLRLSDAGRV